MCQRAKGFWMCVCVLWDRRRHSGWCPCNVSVDILLCYWCWLQSDCFITAWLPGCKTLSPTFSHSLSVSISVSSCLHLLLSSSLSCLSCVFLYPRMLLLQWPRDCLGWESCRGPFQHASQLCYLDRELCGRTGAIRRKGQGEAINTLWNWCGSKTFRKCCKDKQHCIMFLLTFPCIAQLTKDDKMNCFGVPFRKWFLSFFPHLAISY